MLLPMFLSKCKTAVPSGTNLGSMLENITIVSGTHDRPILKITGTIENDDYVLVARDNNIVTSFTAHLT